MFLAYYTVTLLVYDFEFATDNSSNSNIKVLMYQDCSSTNLL